MKANELMIGDWVIDTRKNCERKPIQITGESFVKAKADGAYARSVIECDPIPLTEEILKKNGFKDGQYFAELYIQGWHVISDAHNLCMECERGWHMNIPCRCLHELQHAFNLVGINMDFAV